jgi:WD40-like Beta Propeller Repeat/Pacifastin inhibitor (LCMII)
MRRESLLFPFLVSLMAVGSCDSRPLGSTDGGLACEYTGVQRTSGSSFPSSDGCNSCTCSAGGQVACTLRACSSDAGPINGTGGRPVDAGGLPGSGGRAGDGGPSLGSGGLVGATGGRPSGSGGNVGSGGIVGGTGGRPIGGLPICGSGPSTDNTPGSIFFDSDQANFNRDIYMIRPNGTGLTRLTSALSIEKEPTVAPDGGRIAFTSDREGALQIYLMDLATKNVTRLTNMFAGADQSRFSRDGQLLAFHSSASVYVIHPDGTGQTLVATGLDPFNGYFWPDFSANDQEVVFDRNNEIDAVRLDGSGLRMVVSNWTTTIRSPSVSPSGSELAYSVFCDTGLSIWTTPFSTNTTPCGGRRLTPVGEPDARRPAWGPGDVFAYERVNKATNVASIVLLARASGSLPCSLTPDGADSRNPAWSP